LANSKLSNDEGKLKTLTQGAFVRLPRYGLYIEIIKVNEHPSAGLSKVLGSSAQPFLLFPTAQLSP
jgi:hypothetical protein